MTFAKNAALAPAICTCRVCSATNKTDLHNSSPWSINLCMSPYKPGSNFGGWSLCFPKNWTAQIRMRPAISRETHAGFVPFWPNSLCSPWYGSATFPFSGLSDPCWLGEHKGIDKKLIMRPTFMEGDTTIGLRYSMVDISPDQHVSIYPFDITVIVYDRRQAVLFECRHTQQCRACQRQSVPFKTPLYQKLRGVSSWIYPHLSTHARLKHRKSFHLIIPPCCDW